MNEKNILEITSEDLAFVDDNGGRQLVVFAECYQRYADQWSDPVRVKRFKEGNASMSDDELEASIKFLRAVKEIGGRDFSVPMIAFYTEPLIEFTFLNKDEYDKIVYAVRKAGWRLRDWA